MSASSIPARPAGAPPMTASDRWVLGGLLGLLALLPWAAWRSAQPLPTVAETRPDAPSRTWTISCAGCHGPDGLGVSGRGGDVSGADPAALAAVLDRPEHDRARRELSPRQVELVAEHLEAIRAAGRP